MTKSKHLLIATILGLASAFSASAWADSSHECQGNACNGDTITNTNSYSTVNNAGGVGFGGSVGNVSSTSAGGSGGAGGAGGSGGAGGAGGNATIQTGAVRNDVNNEQFQHQSQTANGGSVRDSGNATIEKGAVQNTNANVNVSTANGGAVRNSGNSSSNSNANASNNGNGNGNNSNNITFQAPKTYRPPVNSAFAPTIFPTAPCMGSSSVGGSGTLFSFSGGTSWESKECMLLETARSFDQAGFRDDALHIRCQGKYAKEAPSCKALANGTKPAVAATPATSAEVNRATEQQLEVVTTETATVTQVANPVGQ